MTEWTRTVQQAAESARGGEPPFAGEVTVTITYFFEGASPDIDNIPKPILDALNGLAYEDDVLVSDLLCRKRHLEGDLRIRAASPLLLETRGQLRPFLHVTVDQALAQEVTA